MNLFSFLDKHGSALLMGVLALLVYFKIKKSAPKASEQAQATHSAHLVRPPRPADGAPLAEQREYAAKIDVYAAAVVAENLFNGLDSSHFMWVWDRKEKVTKNLTNAAEAKVKFRMVEEEYKLIKPGADLLSELREFLGNDFSSYVSKLNMK